MAWKTSENERGEPIWEVKNGGPILQDHHVVPSSRGGKRNHGNILFKVPSDTHWAYHLLFGNLMPLEIIDVLLRTFFCGGRFRREYRRIINDGEQPPNIDPDKLLLALVRKVFPKDWVPSEELIQSLIERGRRLS